MLTLVTNNLKLPEVDSEVVREVVPEVVQEVALKEVVPEVLLNQKLMTKTSHLCKRL